MHRRWLAGLSFKHAAHYIVLEDCIAAVEGGDGSAGIILKPTSKPRFRTGR